MLVDFSGCKDKEVGPKGDFEPIPINFSSEAQILNSKFGKTKDGSKSFLEVEFVLMGEHDFTNRHVWTKCYLHKGANWKLKDLLTATGNYNPTASQQQEFQISMVNGHQVHVVVDSRTYEGKVYNDIKFINVSKVRPPKTLAAAGLSSADSGLSI